MLIRSRFYDALEGRDKCDDVMQWFVNRVRTWQLSEVGNENLLTEGNRGKT
jgi:hypothetical protein